MTFWGNDFTCMTLTTETRHARAMIEGTHVSMFESGPLDNYNFSGDEMSALFTSLDDNGQIVGLVPAHTPALLMHDAILATPHAATPAPSYMPFRWEACSYSLHSESGELWPEESGLQRRPNLSVQMQRAPPLVEGGTFRWHKNCVLPLLRVSVDELPAPFSEGAVVLLSAVTVDVLTNAARSIGLKGETLRPLVSGECHFASLAFTTTSYNLPGRPSVHLMASLMVRNGTGRLRVVSSTLSPALTVDARKRQSVKQAAAAEAPSPGQPLASVLPFAPEMLETKLSKVCKDAAGPLPIDNSIDGLRAYLSALNIRNKCKHPLFFALRFDSCIGLLFDASVVRSPMEDDQAFYQMLAAISAVARATGHAPPSQGGGFEPYVLAIKGEHPDGECEHGATCPVRLSAGFALPHASTLPPTYTMLCDRQVAALRKTYCRLHCTHSGTPSQAHLAAPREAEMVCGSCNTAHPDHSHPAVPIDATTAAAQRHATALLATATRMAGALHGDGGDGGGGCPEREWQDTMRILAEAMAMHCHTKSTDEIVGFMNDSTAPASSKMRL